MSRDILNIIFIPLLGAFILPLAGKISARLRNWLAFLFIFSSFLYCLKLIPAVSKGEVITATKIFPLGFDLAFSADCLAVFVAAVSSFISAVIVLYSSSYISHYENQNEYYLSVVLFLGAMMGLVFSANLVFLYIFWEITAITSWRLIGFFREKDFVIRADKAFLITFFGALAMLLGFIAIFQQTGSFDLSVIKLALKTSHVVNIAVVLILFGVFSKSATLPFQTWLPDAGVAPSPVTSLLHAAVLVKIGVYVYAKLFCATFILALPWQTVIALIAGISSLIAAGAAYVEKDIKRIIAYSTISQIAFIFLGFAVDNRIGIAGALLFILMHGLGKAGLFLCAGIIEQKAKTKDITKMGGFIKTMPLTTAAFLLCSFSIMGVPPFGGFFSKYMVIAAAINSGHIYIALLFIACAVMTIFYLFRLVNMVFFGELQGEGAKEGSAIMVFSVLLLGALSLLSGILISYPAAFAQAAAKQILGI